LEPRVRITAQQCPFDAALMLFLDDTVQRERRRKRQARWRFAAALICSLLVYEWPYLHSSVAVAMATQHDQSGRVALFARAELLGAIAQAEPVADLRRLAFASADAFAVSQAQEPRAAIAVAAAMGE
jgi:hypothetical protein